MMRKIFILCLCFSLGLIFLVNSYAETGDIGISMSSLSVGEYAYGLNGSVCLKEEDNWRYGLEGSFYCLLTDWGWYSWNKYYTSYLGIAGGGFVEYNVDKTPIFFRLGTGIINETKSNKSKYYDASAGNSSKTDKGSESNLYFRPEIRIKLKDLFGSFSLWVNTEYIENSFSIGFNF